MIKKEFTKKQKVKVFTTAVEDLKKYIKDEQMTKYGEIIDEPILSYKVHDNGETVIVDGDLYDLCFDGYSFWNKYYLDFINKRLKKVDTYVDNMGGGVVLL